MQNARTFFFASFSAFLLAVIRFSLVWMNLFFLSLALVNVPKRSSPHNSENSRKEVKLKKGGKEGKMEGKDGEPESKKARTAPGETASMDTLNIKVASLVGISCDLAVTPSTTVCG